MMDNLLRQPTFQRRILMNLLITQVNTIIVLEYFEEC